MPVRTKTIIVFPYSGYEKKTLREKLFWRMVGLCLHRDAKPVVVINADTLQRGRADAFQHDPRTAAMDTVRVWSVDTCQMWLAGWGHVLDHYPEAERIIQLPGDIDWVDEVNFFRQLEGFLGAGDQWQLVIGDFDTEGRFNAKELIDYYGTYALMANWFPEVTSAVLKMPLNRPRSEFLNVQVSTLKELLGYRKFAYEQTLNMLIRLWDFNTHAWKPDIKVYSHSFGTIGDDASSRQYRECLDQIERTERMLKMLWREIYWREDNDETVDSIRDKYHELDQRSTSVRQNARIIIGNLLRVTERSSPEP